MRTNLCFLASVFASLSFSYFISLRSRTPSLAAVAQSAALWSPGAKALCFNYPPNESVGKSLGLLVPPSLPPHPHTHLLNSPLPPLTYTLNHSFARWHRHMFVHSQWLYRMPAAFLTSHTETDLHLHIFVLSLHCFFSHCVFTFLHIQHCFIRFYLKKSLHFTSLTELKLKYGELGWRRWRWSNISLCCNNSDYKLLFTYFQGGMIKKLYWFKKAGHMHCRLCSPVIFITVCIW